MLSHRQLAGLFLTMLTVPGVAQDRSGPNENSRPARDLVPVFGVIVDPDGKPVPGATVREVRRPLDGAHGMTARRLGHGTRLGATTTTNAHGKFVLKVPAGGVFGIVAMRGAQERSQVVAPAAPAGQHRLVLRRVVRVQGRIAETVRVQDQHRELPTRARVVRSVGTVISGVPGQKPRADFGVIEETTCQPDGTFEVAILDQQACYLVDQFWHERVLATQRQQAAFELLLPVRKVESRVVHNLTGKPLDKALVQLDGRQIPVDANGRFEVHMPIERPMTITSPGCYGFVFPGTYNTSSVGLPEAATATVVMTDQAGNPAAGVDLYARPWPRRGVSKRPLIRYRTDAAGRAVLTRMMDSDYDVMADLDGRLARIATVTGGIDDIRIPVSTRTYTVRGTVVEADGLPCAHIPVYLGASSSLESPRLPGSLPATFTDHAGKFTLPPLPDAKVCITAAWHEHLRAPIVEFAPKKQRTIDLQLRVKR